MSVRLRASTVRATQAAALGAPHAAAVRLNDSTATAITTSSKPSMDSTTIVPTFQFAMAVYTKKRHFFPLT